MKDLRDFLTDIASFAENARKLVETNELKDLASEFSSEGLALERSMEIIGEAVKQIPDELRVQYPEIPWRKVAGLRDMLIHRYWSAQMGRLVEIVKKRPSCPRRNREKYSTKT